MTGRDETVGRDGRGPAEDGEVAAIQAVIFDWGGTLTPWHTIDFEAMWASYAPDPARVAALCAAENSVWTRARDEHRSARLGEVLELAGIPADPAGQARYDSWWDQHTYTDPQVRPLFEALHRRGLAVGILSNTLWTRQRHEAIFARDGVDDLIDGAVYSSEIEHTKPHPAAFHAALTAVGVDDARRAVFVGDRLFDDIWGAGAIGMRTVFVPHSDIPAEQIGHTEGEPDAVVPDLASVLDVVDRWRGA